MKVRLLKKLADRLDGVDLHAHNAGEVFELPPPAARLLVAEQWAIPERREHSRPAPARRRLEDGQDEEWRAS